MNKHLKNIMRWILVLPGSILLAVLALILLHLFLYSTLTQFITPYPEFPERALTPFTFAMTLVWGGYQIAPSSKFRVAIILFALSIFLSGGIIIATLTGGTLF